MKSIIEIYKDKAGEFRFRMKAMNGKIIAQSEGYKAKKSVIKTVTKYFEYSDIYEI